MTTALDSATAPIVDFEAATAAILDRHATDPAAARMALQPVLKARLAADRADIQAAFEDGAINGMACARRAAAVMDALIRAILRAAEALYRAPNPTSGEAFAVLAVGGYGRGELAPASDVDLLFLTPSKPAARTEQCVEFILYSLWDLGLTVGHATRPVDDCIRRAKEDATILTNMLEQRVLAGDKGLAQNLRDRLFDEALRGREADYMRAKLAERDARHQRHGGSRYQLEPNIKEGKGALRDLHTLFWLMKALHRGDQPEDWVRAGVMTARELRALRRAREFMTALRCHMHYFTGREEDRLTFDLQTEVGRRMGFANRAGAVAVERLMKRYFLAAKDVGDLTRIVCAALEDAHEVDTRSLVGRVAARLTRDRHIDGFTVERGRLSEAEDDQFDAEPRDMIRIFRVAQREELDVHPSALRRMRDRLSAVAGLREDAEANALFLAILTAREDPEPALRRMNEAGVLGRFVPEFGKIVSMSQFNMYHVYTVDEHTLYCVGNLHRIETGQRAEDLPLSTDIMPKIASRRALYVAMFLHDVMKGRAGDHSILGERIARKLCPRFGLTDEETETTAWLIRRHLVMSDVAFTRDLDDPETVADFASRIRSPERLRLLLVLTVADIRAVGPHTWTEWKAQLLRRLYWNAHAALTEGFTGATVDRRANHARDAAAEAMTHLPKGTRDLLLAEASPAYWLSFGPETHAHHAHLLAEARDQDDPLLIDTRVDADQGVTEVTVLTRDRPGLLPAITAGLAASGGDIVAARVFTLTNGLALDVFSVQEADMAPPVQLEDRAGSLRDARWRRGAIERPDRLAKLSATIRRAVEGDTLDDALENRRRAAPARAKVFGVAPRVLFDNEGSDQFTLIEVNGRDRPGFLHLVTKALAAEELRIYVAKITSFGEHAVDVFYVKDAYGHKVIRPEKLAAIRRRVESAIRKDDAAMGFPSSSSTAERRSAA